MGTHGVDRSGGAGGAGGPADTSSADVTFEQSGSGATSRTVEAKLRDIVNVRDFGALLDNSNDDTAEINAAVTAVSTAGGGIVFVGPSSGIKTSAAITVPDNVVVEGAGRTATVFKPVGTFNCFEVHGTSFASWGKGRSVRNLEVDGAGLTGRGLSVKYCGLRCYFADLYIHDCTGVGMRIEGSFDHCYERIESRGNSSYGVQVYESQVSPDGVYEEVSKLVFNDVAAIDNNSNGVQWDQAGGDNCSFNECKPSEGSIGIDFSRTCFSHHITNMMYDSHSSGTCAAVRTNAANADSIYVDHLHCWKNTSGDMYGVQVVNGGNVFVGKVYMNGGGTPVRVETTADGNVYLLEPRLTYSDANATPKTFPAEQVDTFTPGLGGNTPSGVLGTGGTLTGAYTKQGRLVHFNIKLVFGTGSTPPGVGFGLTGLPFAAGANTKQLCSVLAYDASTTTYYDRTGYVESSSVAIPDGANFFGDTAASPFDWTDSDELYVTGTYYTD